MFFMEISSISVFFFFAVSSMSWNEQPTCSTHESFQRRDVGEKKKERNKGNHHVGIVLATHLAEIRHPNKTVVFLTTHSVQQRRCSHQKTQLRAPSKKKDVGSKHEHFEMHSWGDPVSWMASKNQTVFTVVHFRCGDEMKVLRRRLTQRFPWRRPKKVRWKLKVTIHKRKKNFISKS